MNTAASPLFVWIDGQMVNMALCQGVKCYEDEEDGWVVSFNMLDSSIVSYHESEHEAQTMLASVFGIMQAHGYTLSES